MKCPSCARDNPDDANFCGQCGTPLRSERPCPACGRANPPELSFCRVCGASLAAGSESETSTPLRIAGGRYIVRDFLGEGGRKRVYRAHDTVLDRDVAIALVKTAGLDEGGRVRVRQEAQAMARLGDHPHVVTVHDIGEEAGEPYIVSQYMPGGALEGLLEQAPGRRLALATTLRIGEGVCRALEHAHRNGIVHRDLKPANVWLAQDGTAKLGDFGLAFSLERSRVTRSGAIVGTVAYMAPEQALGHTPGPASDLYSLGALLYEMVTGRPPFVGDDVVSVISQHQNAEPVAPSWHVPEVPKELERLMLGLLAKAPEERPRDAGEVAGRLERVEPQPEPVAGGALQPSDAANRVESLAEGVFVGREQEVDRLRSALEGSLNGHGRLLLLVGEPGIGKTRTAQELATYARLRGARVSVGRAYEGEGAPAYWPWLQIARSLIHDRGADEVASDMGAGAADIAEVMSEVRDLVPGIAQLPRLDAEQARFRFFDSITTFLKNAAGEEPMVLVLDDLHWADAPSLRLLRFLAGELADSRLLVIGTYRDVALGRRHPLSETMAALSREGLVERVSLHGLSEKEVERYIEVVASIEPPRSLVEAVHEETEGNPFFVSEIVNLLASEGALDRAGELDRFTVTIPQGVREVVGRRLDRLSDDCNRLLSVASVIGREFGAEVLERVAQLDRDRLLELLEEAQGQRIVDEVLRGPALRFQFSHALVRDALYEELGVTQRVRLHRRIAETIEELCGDDREPHLVELSRHFLEAQELERAIDYSTAAGDRAVELLAYEEAASLYEQALQALEVHNPGATRRRCELLIELARAEMRAGDLGRAKSRYDRATPLVRELDDPLLLAAVADGRARWSEVGAVDEAAIALLEEALARLPAEDSEGRASLLSRLAVAVHFRSIEERTRHALDAIAMARRVGDPATLALVLNNCQFALRGPDNLEERLAVDEELIGAAVRAGDAELSIEGRGLYLTDLLEAGDIEGVQREVELYSSGAQTLRQPPYIRYALIRRAMIETLVGRFAEAEEILEELGSPQLARHDPDPNTNQGIAVVMFWLRRHTGRLDEMRDDLIRFAAAYPAVTAWRAAIARLYAEFGEEAEARRKLEQLVGPDSDVFPRDANWLVAMSLVAEVAHAVGDRERGAWIYSRLAPYERRVVVVGPGWSCSGSVARFLAIVASSLGRYADAERHFEVALEGNGRLGARPFVALTEHNYAQMLAERGDVDRADRLVGNALETARVLGMKRLVEQCFELRLRLQGLETADVLSSIDAVAAEVEDERPDLRGHTAPDGTVTILFSDIERSTELNERLGDRRFLTVLREHNEIIRSHLHAHRGFEVKSQGDGFMIAFADPRVGVDCAIEIQRALAIREEEGGEPVRVRMGLHTGEAIRERDDFFGRNVVVAARIAAQARGGEILVSSMLKELADGDGSIAFGEPRELDLKGLSGSHRVHAVDWQPAGAGAGR